MDISLGKTMFAADTAAAGHFAHLIAKNIRCLQTAMVDSIWDIGMQRAANVSKGWPLCGWK